MNAINVIHPYRWNNMWVFDDESKELDKEPLIAGADTLVTSLVNGAQKCSIMFAETKFPATDLFLTKMGPGIGDGTNYIFDVTAEIKHPVWLCPALLCYFNEAPEIIYFKVITE